MLQYIKKEDISVRADGKIVAIISEVDIPYQTPDDELRFAAFGAIDGEFVLVSDFRAMHADENVIYR